MLITILHATTYENYLSIMKEGFKPKSDKMTWNVSNPNHMYFFLYDFSKNEFYNFKRTLFNARITASSQNSKSKKIVIFKLEVDEDLINYDISANGDKKNEEYDSNPTYTIDVDKISSDMITKIYVIDNIYNPEKRIEYLSLVVGNSFFNKSNIDKKIIEKLKNQYFNTWDLFHTELKINDVVTISM